MHFNKPAVIMELKWDKSAKGANQSDQREAVCGCFKGKYQGNLLLVGINCLYIRNSV